MESKLPDRKPTRLKNYDYNKTGMYFLTICTENRKQLLSTIVGEGSPLPKLSVYGKITEKQIKEIPIKYPQIKLDQYVIMPDHIHLILFLNSNTENDKKTPTIVSVIGWLKYQITKEINKSRGTTGERIFQRSFFDHVIRDRKDYEIKRDYIRDNPNKWYYDHLNE